MLTDDQESFRARGRTFGGVATAYAAYRPGYPGTALDWALAPVADRGCATLLDLAAGTGKLTASLVGRGGKVIAVEPDPDMLAVLRTQLSPPAGPVVALSGSAERIPLPDASVDAVLVGQAFHWFDPVQAGAEVARVLRPGGVLAALWNHEDGSVDWVAGYHRAASEDRRVPGVPKGEERADLPTFGVFSATVRAEFGHTRRLTVDGLINVIGTHSWALVSERAERERVYGRVRDYFAGRPELTSAPDGAFDLPLRTVVLRAVRADERATERR